MVLKWHPNQADVSRINTYIESFVTPLNRLQKALEENTQGFAYRRTFNGYGRTTKQQINTQDINTPLGRGRPRSSRWIKKKRSGLLRSGVMLLDDHVRPDSAMSMQNHIATIDFENLYNTDIHS
ncbi:hypothetical protein TNCV_3952821 [Trichonephila clavipes]|nr:hypothetical protein TNCV_3952821 [Trichonephila clavipes]